MEKIERARELVKQWNEGQITANKAMVLLQLYIEDIDKEVSRDNLTGTAEASGINPVKINQNS